VRLRIRYGLLTPLFSFHGEPPKGACLEAIKLRADRRFGTQAWLSDEVVARTEPVAVPRVPSLFSGQGLVSLAAALFYVYF
jgi:hypothetical protein